MQCYRWLKLLLKLRNQFLCLELDLNFTEITTPGSVLGSGWVSLPQSGSVMKISLNQSSPELVIDRSNQWWGHSVRTLSPLWYKMLIMFNWHNKITKTKNVQHGIESGKKDPYSCYFLCNIHYRSYTYDSCTLPLIVLIMFDLSLDN